MSNDFDPANVPVVQVDPDTVVTRQIGIAPSQLVLATDPQPPPEVIQGDAEVFVTRQTGNGHSYFGTDGVLYADHPSTENILHSDGPIAPADQPPTVIDLPARPSAFEAVHGGALVAWAKPDQAPAPAAAPTAAIMQADRPDDRGDPRDTGGAPQIISALPQVKKTPPVPIVISASGAVQVGDEGAKSGRKSKKGKG